MTRLNNFMEEELYNFFIAPVFKALILINSLIPGGDLGLALLIFAVIVKAAIFPILYRIEIKHQAKGPFFSYLAQLLIQLPLLIAIFYFFSYSFNTNQDLPTLNFTSFGLIDLSSPSLTTSLIVSLALAWKTNKVLKIKQPQSVDSFNQEIEAGSKKLIFLLPALTLLAGLSLPAGFIVYWFFAACPCFLVAVAKKIKK